MVGLRHYRSSVAGIPGWCQTQGSQGPRTIRLIWADKIALLAGFLCSLLLLFLWSLAFFVVGGLGAKHMWASFGIRGVGLAILAVGTMWFAMRATDLLAGWFPHRPFTRLAP
jgi:hypothetical protein